MANKKEKSELLPIRRQLRSKQTPAEQLLWAKLRNKQIHGLIFRRQHGIDSYIVDFFCPEPALAIEVASDVHATERRIRNDRQREQHLSRLGIRIIRYTHNEVLHNLDGVLKHLRAELSRNSTSPTPSLQRRGDQPSVPPGKQNHAEKQNHTEKLVSFRQHQGTELHLSRGEDFQGIEERQNSIHQEERFAPQPLPRAFFNRPTLKVAQELLGKYLIRETSNGLLQTRIVDVEAYVGPEDKACHASKGRTKRTEILFGPPGMVYVYLIYGMYHCLNLVTEREEFPAAILIRGLEVHEETDSGFSSLRIDGPGRVCRFLSVDRTDNGLDATSGSRLWVEDRGHNNLKAHIQMLPRIGVDYAGEWAQKPWRFCLPAPPSPKKRKTLFR